MSAYIPSDRTILRELIEPSEEVLTILEGGDELWTSMRNLPGRVEAALTNRELPTRAAELARRVPDAVRLLVVEGLVVLDGDLGLTLTNAGSELMEQRRTVRASMGPGREATWFADMAQRRRAAVYGLKGDAVKNDKKQRILPKHAARIEQAIHAAASQVCAKRLVDRVSSPTVHHVEGSITEALFALWFNTKGTRAAVQLHPLSLFATDISKPLLPADRVPLLDRAVGLVRRVLDGDRPKAEPRIPPPPDIMARVTEAADNASARAPQRPR